MMQQIVLNKKYESENASQTSCLVGSDAKNALPTAMDIAGLSWILKDDD